MPTNLPGEAKAKLAEYQSARKTEDKIRILSEAISLIPDHKGTEKLRRQLKKRLAELRREVEERRAKRVSGKDAFSVEKEGWAQIALIGVANSGKSSILNLLTGASSPVAEYPMTTTRPTPGMMLFEGAEIQLVDLPPVLTDDLCETSIASRSLGVARNSDSIALVVDSCKDPVRQLEALVNILEDYGMTIKPRKCEVEVEKTDSGGLRLVIMGKLDCGYDEVRRLLLELGLRSAIVKIKGDARLEELEEQLVRELSYKRALVILNKIDMAEGEEIKAASELAGSMGIKAIGFSAKTGKGLEVVKYELFRSLGMIRIYTQKDGQPSPRPILIREGATVRQLAELIHRELADKMRYARVWGRSVKVQGERVGPDYVLRDLDLIEIKS